MSRHGRCSLDRDQGGIGRPAVPKTSCAPAGVRSGDRSTIVYATVCTKARKPILARDDVHALLREAWSEGLRWQMGRYMIMPDHLHFFTSPATFPAEPIRSWTSFWKSHVTRHWPRRAEQPVWQVDVWDTQPRASDSYAAKWIYVRENPVRAGLVARSEDWPYQGELSVLRWHDR